MDTMSTPPPTTDGLTYLGDLVPRLGITHRSAHTYCVRHHLGTLIGHRRFLSAAEVERLVGRPGRGNKSGRTRRDGPIDKMSSM